MAAEELVMKFEKPHFTVKLHATLLEVDLKRGVKKELEDVLEAKPALRESLGFLFQTIVPLDVPLRNVGSVNVDRKGQVRIVIPSRRDIVIPLKPAESKRLVGKMNELIAIEKERAVRELQESRETRRMLVPKVARAQADAESIERIR